MEHNTTKTNKNWWDMVQCATKKDQNLEGQGTFKIKVNAKISIKAKD